MRRAVTSLLAAVALAASMGLALPVTATAQECEGYGCARANYERTRDLPAYGSRYDGYWDRRGEGRRDRGHHRRDHRGDHRRDRDHHDRVHYYPGYGYYAGRTEHRGDYRSDHRGERAGGCRDQRHDRRGERQYCD